MIFVQICAIGKRALSQNKGCQRHEDQEEIKDENSEDSQSEIEKWFFTCNNTFNEKVMNNFNNSITYRSPISINSKIFQQLKMNYDK